MTRQWLFLVPCVLGALGLYTSRRAGDGTAGFYAATVFTAIVYAAAWWALGNRRAFAGPGKAAEVLRGSLVGALLAGVFILGALVVQHIPVLSEPASQLLDTPSKGGYALTLLVLVINGIGEELVYRDVVPRQLRAHGQSVMQAGVWSTVIYALVTISMGVPLLVFAAAVLGAMTYNEAARTGRLYSPIAVHLTWSIGMLLILPSVF